MMLHEHIYEDMKQSRLNASEHLLLFSSEVIKEPTEENTKMSSESQNEEDRPNVE